MDNLQKGKLLYYKKTGTANQSIGIILMSTYFMLYIAGYAEGGMYLMYLVALLTIWLFFLGLVILLASPTTLEIYENKIILPASFFRRKICKQDISYRYTEIGYIKPNYRREYVFEPWTGGVVGHYFGFYINTIDGKSHNVLLGSASHFKSNIEKLRNEHQKIIQLLSSRAVVSDMDVNIKFPFFSF